MAYYLIGTDEAGYGPFLGPLAVSATLWEVAENTPPDGLYAALAPAVGVSPKDAVIAVADSKKLYKTSVYKSLSGIAAVEKTVLTMMEILRLCDHTGGYVGEFPASAEDVFSRFGDEASCKERAALVWQDAAIPFPLSNSLDVITEAANTVLQKMRDTQIFLREVRSDLIFPARFNREAEETGSKGVLLMEATLKLASALYAKARRQTPSAEVVIFCDKLGGRNFYLAPLMEFFSDATFCITEENRDTSEYVHRGESGTLTVRFQAKGETNLAVALASLFSKYQRELAMIGFNAWWQARVPGLTPTEGYPQDARRFLDDIKKTAETLGISRDFFWRNR